MSHHMGLDFFFYYFFQWISFSSVVILLFFKPISSYSLPSNEYLGSTGKHLFHFVQVTDIHITHIQNTDRMEQFEQFCNEIIKTLIKPRVTVVSGDLVNSVGGLFRGHGRMFGVEQYEEEWNIYRSILNRTNVTKHTKWLDIKGNHDTFMEPHSESSKSFYRIYSNQGQNHSGSYEHTLRTTDGDSYSFVSVDLCPRPGLGPPFNFYGSITQKELKNLAKLSERTKNSTSTIFFGHYPLAFTYSYGLDQIMQNALVYLNGHLHAGIKHLYALHSNGLLELELGDWKRNRRFRIVTIDSGLLSFGDFRFNQSIYGVISNPKSATFKTPREPLDRLSQSTHIRILIFARLSIVSVNISIDGQYIGLANRSIDNSNLFVLPWNTSFYNDGNLHEINVEIKDKGNNRVTLKHMFSLTLSTITSWNRSKIILTIHQPTFIVSILIVSLCVYILALLFYRYQAKRKSCIFTSRFGLWNRFCLRMTLLCSVDFLYYSLLGFALYYFIGPWYIGYVTKGYFGAIFLWGIIVQGVYLRPDSQILTGTFQLYFFLFPLTLTLSSICYYRYTQLQSYVTLIKPRFNRCWRIYTVYILFFYTLFFLLFWSFVMTASYKFGWLLSPFALTLILSTIILYVKSHRLKLEDFKLLSSRKSIGIMIPINQDNSKINDEVDEQRTVLHNNKFQ